jgi:hypothetical protein
LRQTCPCPGLVLVSAGFFPQQQWLWGQLSALFGWLAWCISSYDSLF